MANKASANHGPGDCSSLSPGERVRMRAGFLHTNLTLDFMVRASV
jgi:hypothetical protein